MGLLKFEWEEGQKRPQGAEPLLSVRHISVRLGQRLVLDDVSLNVYEGERVRITGPNGAGKSTLFNAVMGLVPVNKGQVLYRGRNICSLPIHERAALGIGYMKQRNNLFSALTVAENLRLAAGTLAYEKFRGRFPEWAPDLTPGKMASLLSGGQKQKLAWAMTLLADPHLILADEPSTGSHEKLTPPAGVTACMIEHDIQEISQN